MPFLPCIGSVARPLLVVGVVVLGLGVVSPLGCGRGGVHGVSSGGPSWVIVSENSTPGIDEGSAAVLKLQFGPPAGVTVVLWSDVSSIQSSASTTRDRAYAVGHIRGRSGTKVPYRCETLDGVTASVSIADRPHDSSAGGLFLVSTLSDPPRVKQLARDLTALPVKAEAIREFALADAEIAEFFGKAKSDSDAGVAR